MRIGIDLGGTKIEGILLSASGEQRARLRVDTPRSYDASVGAIVALVRELDAQAAIDVAESPNTSDAVASLPTVGIGIPGAIVPETGFVKNANSVWLNGQPLPLDLERALARPVRVMNDANCFALSEATDGAAQGASVVFGVILGTGVGGGVVIEGNARIGPNLIAGEWGHNPLPWPTAEEVAGPECYCGKRGCIETWLSGPGLERDHAQQTALHDRAQDPTNNVSRSPLHVSLRIGSRDIVRLAEAGDRTAMHTMSRYYNRLARALATVINILDPDVIVLGGGMSNVAGLVERVNAELPGWVFSDNVKTRLARHMHGDSSGVRGAAWLWPA